MMTNQGILGLGDRRRHLSHTSYSRFATGAALVLFALLPGCSSSDSNADSKAGSSSSAKGGKSSAGGAKGNAGATSSGEGGSGAIAGAIKSSGVAGVQPIPVAGGTSGSSAVASGGTAPGTGGTSQTASAVAAGGAIASGGASATGGVAPTATGGVANQAGASGNQQGGNTGVAGSPAKPLFDLSRPECKTCMDQWCTNIDYAGPDAPEAYPLCNGLTGTAEDGPAAGTDRKKLCNTLYDCINRTRCPTLKEQSPYQYPETGLSRFVDITLQPCYCGSDVTGLQCTDGGQAHGACKREYENALETTVPGDVAFRFTTLGLAGGNVGLFLVNCVGFCIEHCEAK